MLGDWLRKKRTEGLLWVSSKTLSVRALSKLVEDLSNKDAKIRWDALWTLEAFIKGLAGEEEHIGAAAIKTLHELDVVIPLTDALRAEDTGFYAQYPSKQKWPYRSRVAQMLGAIGDEEAVPPLIDALRDPYYSVRGGAAWALGQLGDSRAVAPLLAALSDEREGQLFEIEEELGTTVADEKRKVAVDIIKALKKLGHIVGRADEEPPPGR